jgi:lysophospholipase L1-like esterase
VKWILSKGAWKEAAKTIAAMCLVFALIEILIRVSYLVRTYAVDYIPLPYVIAGDYGPVPPWQDGRGLIRPDPVLVWRGQPDFRQKFVDVFNPVNTEDELRSLRHSFFPALPDSLKGSPHWEISTNSEGFRDVEFSREKASSVFRILCLGDSWTFGANVGQDEAYPQRLSAQLRQEFPNAQFEVLNLGVLGYASYNGLKLLKTRALDLHPDMIVLSFAMNEPNMAGYRESAPAKDGPLTLTGEMRHVAAGTGLFFSNHIEIYRLLRYWALRINWHPRSVGEQLKEMSRKLASFERDDWDDKTLEPWMQASLMDYKQYYSEMIEAATAEDASVILLYNEFWTNGPYRMALETVATAASVPVIDSSSLLATATHRIEDELERKLGLPAPADDKVDLRGETEVIFRVYMGERAVPETVYITGADEGLGKFKPNTIAMHDDGKHGDQRASDNVWSYSVQATPGATLFYVYTNSGAQGKWEGLDVPGLRRFKVDAANAKRRVYAPIDTFGQMYMHADPWHTNAAGNNLIAKAVLGALKEHPRVQQHLSEAAR